MRRFVAELIGFVALTIAVPLAAEVVLRLLDVRTETPVFQPATDVGGSPVMRLAWNPQFRRPQAAQPHRDFPIAKAPGTVRIFVVGESEAEGVPYGTDLAFTSWLGRRLAAQAPQVHWEVVNAALGGLQSWGALEIVDDIARQHPDLLIVYLGHNEAKTRYSEQERRWIDPRGFAWRAWILRTRLYEALSRILPARAASQMIDPREVDLRGFFSVSADGSRAHSGQRDRSLSAAVYGARLVDMVRTMRAVGARTMLLTLSQNFSDWPPGFSSHRPGMRPDEKAAFRAAVRAGDALASTDCQAALAAWSTAVALDDGFAALQFRMATCEKALGRLDAASARFRRSSDLDGIPQGAPTAFNDVIRTVAAEQDAILVDLDLIFARTSGPALVGNDLFIDSEHMTLRAHQLIAQVVADAIRESGIAGPTVRWNPDAYVDPDPEALLAANPDLRFKENLVRLFACNVGGRPECSPQ
jgi:lysophospholipase L1-like esterase